jgi:hypothetical protein
VGPMGREGGVRGREGAVRWSPMERERTAFLSSSIGKKFGENSSIMYSRTMAGSTCQNQEGASPHVATSSEDPGLVRARGGRWVVCAQEVRGARAGA